MTGHYAVRHFVDFEPRGHVVVAQARWIEPLLQTRDRAVVTVQSPIPDTTKRRDFVQARSLARLEGQIRIGPNRDGQNILVQRMVLPKRKSSSQRQLVVSVKRRSMAAWTTFPIKELSYRRLLLDR